MAGANRQRRAAASSSSDPPRRLTVATAAVSAKAAAAAAVQSCQETCSSPRSLSPVPGRSGSQQAKPVAARPRIVAASNARVRFISSNKGGRKSRAGPSPIRIIHSSPSPTR